MTAQPVGATQVPLRRYQVTALERRQPGIALGGRLRRHILELMVLPQFGSIGQRRLGLNRFGLFDPMLVPRARRKNRRAQALPRRDEVNTSMTLPGLARSRCNSTRLSLSIESLLVPSLKGRKRLLPSQRE
jgi:hypothetical protein